MKMPEFLLANLGPQKDLQLSEQNLLRRNVPTGQIRAADDSRMTV